MGKAARNFFLATFYLFSPTHAHISSTGLGGPASQDVCAIDPKSIVSDACASYSTLDALNAKLQPHIRSLTQSSDFFSYYRLNLFSQTCPFWSDENGMCGNIACAVNTIENEQDIPLIWRAAELGKLQGPRAQHPNRRLQREPKPLMGELGENVGESCVVEYDDEDDERDYCVPEDESSAIKGDYVSLLDNPERYTGYSGDSAHQVWEAIYRENCFSTPPISENEARLQHSSLFSGKQGQAAQGLRQVLLSQQQLDPYADGPRIDDSLDFDDQCLEKRVFYRIISGMHASISTHICWDYLNQTTKEWAPNLQCYEQRLHHHPDWISNLYFNYALVSRALAKAKPALESYTFCAGDLEQDRLTKKKILALADAIASAPNIYDESLMFQDASVSGLKNDFRNRFRNVSRTMDCVGCDKCRLWGKLQVAGYGTALKILFDFDQLDNSKNPPLRRTELVALVNTLDKISSSLAALAKFTAMLEPEHVAASRPISSVGTAPTAEALSSIYEDDGLRDEALNVMDSSFSEDFLDEFYTVWHTFKWIIRRWANLPSEIFHIVLTESIRLFKMWLGQTVEPRGYEIRYPPSRDEI